MAKETVRHRARSRWPWRCADGPHLTTVRSDLKENQLVRATVKIGKSGRRVVKWPAVKPKH